MRTADRGRHGEHCTAEPTRLLTREFWTLAAAASLYFLGLGALNSLLPTYVVDELGGSAATSGVVMGSLAISALMTRVFFGRIADRRGARRILVMGSAIATTSMLVLMAVPTVAGALVARVVLGAGGAAIVTGSTTLAIQLAPVNRRAQAVSYVLIAFHVGMGMGPVGGEVLLRRLSYGGVWVVVAIAVGLSGVVAMALRHRPGDPTAEPAPLIQRNAIAPGFTGMFGIFAFAGFLMFLPLYGPEVGLSEVGLVFTTASATIVAARLFLGRVPDVIGPVRTGTGAVLLTLFASSLVALWAAPAGLFVGAALLACGLSLQPPSFISIAVDGVSDRERGAAMATFTAFSDVAIALVGPTLGFIVAGFGYRAAFLTTSAMSLVALAILHLVVAPRWQQRRSLAVTAAA